MVIDTRIRGAAGLVVTIGVLIALDAAAGFRHTVVAGTATRVRRLVVAAVGTATIDGAIVDVCALGVLAASSAAVVATALPHWAARVLAFSADAG
jgi:hypothetical protein